MIRRQAAQRRESPALPLLVVALAATASACLDWDALRAGPGGLSDPDRPFVAWRFGGTGVVASVANVAPGGPDPELTIDASSLDLQGARLQAGAVTLMGALLTSSPQAARAIGDRLLAGGGSFTVELWLDGIDAADDVSVLRCTSGGFGITELAGVVRATVYTSAGPLTAASSAIATAVPHQLALAFDGAAAGVAVYLDGAAAGAATAGAGAAATLSWAPLDLQPHSVVELGPREDAASRITVRAVTMFDRALDAATVAARFGRGAP